jgi:hypothetical protein
VYLGGGGHVERVHKLVITSLVRWWVWRIGQDGLMTVSWIRKHLWMVCANEEQYA